MIYVTAARLESIKERWVDKKSKKRQYTFVVSLEWSDGSSSIVWRSYSDFFELQCQLLDTFPEEAGSKRGSVRIIPYLPGRQIFRKSDLALAEGRFPAIESYIKDLIKLPTKISQSSVVVSFFQRKQSDPEWFEQFPQNINKLSEHGDSFESRTENKRVLQEPGDCIGLSKDGVDNDKETYMNPTFEASGSLS